MNAKKVQRLRRARRGRARMNTLGVHRLSVYRSSAHIYAQVIAPNSQAVIACASTVEADLRSAFGGNVSAAQKVGQLIAQRAVAAGIDSVAFDRSGYQYHGRIKALAEAARDAGLKF